jgi:hypothetical protein
MITRSIADRLLESDDAVIRYQARIRLLGEKPSSRAAQRERAQIPKSPIVKQLLGDVNRSGIVPGDPYVKWRGSHWVMAFLAELGYPPGDKSLRPMIDRNAKWALGISANLVNGRWRRCASQQGYALLYLIKLGFYDERCDELANRLMIWQWPDGGWNCDKIPSAHCSSFHESLIPTRALFHYAHHTKRKDALAAAQRAAEFFLERHLYRSKRSGKVIKEMFTLLKYPYDWRYSFIHALKCMAEAGLIKDPRCSDAFDLLEEKRQSNGGWRPEVKYYTYNKSRPAQSTTTLNWTASNIDGISPFLTCDATYILRAAGRM